MTDIDIIKNLKGGPLQHNKALAYLYSSREHKDPILFFLKSRGLSKNDVQTLWTDIVVKFGLLVKSGKYEHQDKIVGYIKNLAGYMVLNFFRDQKKAQTADIEMSLIKNEYIESSTLYHKELKELFQTQLSEIGDVCKSILNLWSMDYSMDEIMNKLKFVSVEATRKRKHICLKKLLDKVSSNDELISLLKEYKYDLNS